MLLASVSDIRTALGFDNMTDINNAIAAALHSAEPQIAAALLTKFSEHTVTDTFWIETPNIVEGAFFETQLWLSQRFVKVSSSPDTPTYSARVLPGNAEFPITRANIGINSEKGVLTDFVTDYRNVLLSVTYVSGFETDTSDSKSYKLSQVPSWLQQAATLLALINLAGSPPLTQAGVEIDSSSLKKEYDSLITDHIPYAPLALLPK